MKNTRLAFLTLGLLFAAGAAVFAAETDKSEGKKYTLTLKNGKVLEDAYILDKKPNGITLASKDGNMFVPFSDMPLEYQQKFGYDPIKSARYERKLDDQKKLAAREEAVRKAKEEQRKADADKRYKDKQISMQQQKVRKLELQLEEAKKRLETTEKNISQSREALGMSNVSSSEASIESPWGYGGRIRGGQRNAAVTNKLMKELDSGEAKRGNQVQDVIELQLKLEAAQRTLDTMIEKKK